MNKIAAIMAMAALFASCDVETTTVMFDEDHRDMDATDTVFSVLGILAQWQMIAERTVLLNETRGDLVETDDTDLLALSDMDYDSDSAKSLMRDYYAVINNSNYFLTYADSTMERGGSSVFHKERAAVSAIRAWCYLHLSQLYGDVPFYTEPLITYSDITARHERRSMDEICSWLIDDLSPYVDTDYPSYGDFSYSSSATFASSMFFLPVRLLIGDLYLWRGSVTGSESDFVEAAEHYRDYLVENELYADGSFVNEYTSNDFSQWTSGWNNIFLSARGGGERISFIPMATTAAYGHLFTLADKFALMEGSSSLKAMTDNAQYCYTGYDAERFALTKDTTYYGSVDNPVYLNYITVEEEPKYTFGDLRLYQHPLTEDYTMSVSKYRQSLPLVTTYRAGVVYLRLCEAICRAGYPNTAFIMLKYGLSRGNLVAYDANGELRRLINTGRDFYDFGDNDENIGLHSRGCGNTESDASFIINETVTDSVAFVEDKIIDEMALETAYEGYRFADLMRFAFRRGESFLANRVAARNTASAALAGLLNDKSSWYLPQDGANE